MVISTSSDELIADHITDATHYIFGPSVPLPGPALISAETPLCGGQEMSFTPKLKWAATAGLVVLCSSLRCHEIKRPVQQFLLFTLFSRPSSTMNMWVEAHYI